MFGLLHKCVHQFVLGQPIPYGLVLLLLLLLLLLLIIELQLIFKCIRVVEIERRRRIN